MYALATTDAPESKLRPTNVCKIVRWRRRHAELRSKSHRMKAEEDSIGRQNFCSTEQILDEPPVNTISDIEEMLLRTRYANNGVCRTILWFKMHVSRMAIRRTSSYVVVTSNTEAIVLLTLLMVMNSMFAMILTVAKTFGKPMPHMSAHW